MNRRKYPRVMNTVGLVIALFLSLPAMVRSSPADETRISAEKIEYFAAEKKFVGTGAVTIEGEGAVVRADEITYLEETAEVFAEGHVAYDDGETSMSASRARLNLDARTGSLTDARVFHKKGHYYMTGSELERRGDRAFFSPHASFTTCDAPVPAWCFTGKDVDVVVGERMTTRDATFRIKNVPVLYTPYLWAPVIMERKTGFLMPTVSNSDSRGFGVRLPFFLVLAENRDATLVLDSFSKRGIGTGLEYRYIEPGGTEGSWWGYHIRDRDLHKDYWELNGVHEYRPPTGPTGFLSLQLLNEKDFYREYSPYRDIRTRRFLESTGEISLPLGHSRAYLLSQYWTDLQYETDVVPQRLPELGYVLYYRRVGDFLLTTSITGANIWREAGTSAGRIDVYPSILHSIGKGVVLSQKVGVRGTAYDFYRNQNVDENALRLAFEYDVTAGSRFIRRYASFLHVVEPSLRYHYITSSENNLPVLDVTEFYKKTSVIEASIVNRIILPKSEALTFRLTQAMDTENGDRPFLPLRAEITMSTPLAISANATFNVHTGKIETTSSEISIPLPKAAILLGQIYNRAEDIRTYRAGLRINPLKSVEAVFNIWYDDFKGETQDMDLVIRYLRQCWGIRIEATKQGHDLTVMVMLELLGLNAAREGI